MGKVIAGGSVSLDRFIAGRDAASSQLLFAWLAGGDIEYSSVVPAVALRFAPADYDWFAALNDAAGALVIGRRVVDDFEGRAGATRSISRSWSSRTPSPTRR